MRKPSSAALREYPRASEAKFRIVVLRWGRGLDGILFLQQPVRCSRDKRRWYSARMEWTLLEAAHCPWFFRQIGCRFWAIPSALLQTGEMISRQVVWSRQPALPARSTHSLFQTCRNMHTPRQVPSADLYCWRSSPLHRQVEYYVQPSARRVPIDRFQNKQKIWASDHRIAPTGYWSVRRSAAPVDYTPKSVDIRPHWNMPPLLNQDCQRALPDDPKTSRVHEPPEWNHAPFRIRRGRYTGGIDHSKQKPVARDHPTRAPAPARPRHTPTPDRVAWRTGRSAWGSSSVLPV